MSPLSKSTNIENLLCSGIQGPLFAREHSPPRVGGGRCGAADETRSPRLVLSLSFYCDYGLLRTVQSTNVQPLV